MGMLMRMPGSAKDQPGVAIVHWMSTACPFLTMSGSGLTVMPPPQPAPETEIWGAQLSGVQFGLVRSSVANAFADSARAANAPKCARIFMVPSLIELLVVVVCRAVPRFA